MEMLALSTQRRSYLRYLLKNALILWNLKYGIVEYMLYQYLIVIDFSFYQSNI